MYLCYVDESGYNGNKFDQNQPVQTMVGIFPNAYKFHRSDSEFKNVFDIIKENVPISELKAEEIYRGRKCWKRVKPETRNAVIEYYLQWIKDRNHKFIVTAIDNKKFFDLRSKEPQNIFIKRIQYPYLLSGVYIALVIQKLNRRRQKNKGKTILIFDEQSEFEDSLCEIISDPPDFVDDFAEFDLEKEKTRLNQIIDSAFFVKSHHSSMAQVVDIVAFLFRLHLQLSFYGFPESYEGETKKIIGWIKMIENKFVPFAKVYPRGCGGFVKFLNSVKAEGIK